MVCALAGPAPDGDVCSWLSGRSLAVEGLIAGGGTVVVYNAIIIPPSQKYNKLIINHWFLLQLLYADSVKLRKQVKVCFDNRDKIRTTKNFLPLNTVLYLALPKNNLTYNVYW